MLEPAVVVLRLAQYVGAMILFGSSLFALYALPSSGMTALGPLRWLRPLLAWSANEIALPALRERVTDLTATLSVEQRTALTTSLAALEKEKGAQIALARLLSNYPADQVMVGLVLRYAPFHEGSDKVVAILEAARRQSKFWETLEVLLLSSLGFDNPY